jgi:hypothetical protein
MSNLNIKFNLLSRVWDTEYTAVHPNTISLGFGFTSNTIPVVFKDLSFGIIITNDNIVYYTSYPKLGMVYTSTDQEFLEVTTVTGLMHNTTYNVKAWVDNYGTKSELDYSFTTPNIEPTPDYEVV